MNKKANYILSLLSLFVMADLHAQTDEQKESKNDVPPLTSFITESEGQFGGKTVAYQARAEDTYLTNEKGEVTGVLWSVSYLKKDENDPRTRPVMFVFNGGPGSSSVWLHMGMFGPHVVKVVSDASEDDGAAPYELAANPYGLLDLTDLVFIDPIGTGFSRVVGKGKESDFWGLNEDAASIAQFMRTWISKNNRWLSPKYIAGESFGTTRASAVAEALEGGGQNMALNGLILISQALDYDGSTSIHDNITSYLTYLPSMAATAWYHKKAGKGKTLESFVQECRDFTYDEYAPALYRGNLISDADRTNIESKLTYFTGLDQTYIARSNLRILMHRFQKQLLADQGVVVGRLDGRFMGDDSDDVSEGPHLGDPASYQITSAYTAALNHYFRETLKVKKNRPYLTSNRNINQKWRWRTVPDSRAWEPSPVNVARKLGDVMRRNTDLRVLVANGYYDLITPFFDAEHTFARHGIVGERVTMKYYEGGHMMYTHQEDFEKLAKDIREFLTK